MNDLIRQKNVSVGVYANTYITHDHRLLHRTTIIKVNSVIVTFMENVKYTRLLSILPAVNDHRCNDFFYFIQQRYKAFYGNGYYSVRVFNYIFFHFFKQYFFGILLNQIK